jgi:TATA-binding protein-associated factor Taf7
MEEQIVLRVPAKVAEGINKILERSAKLKTEDQQPTYDVAFQVGSDKFNGQFRLNGETFKAKLCELPTHVESYRTYDNTQFYKSSDIHQMLIVQGGEYNRV